MQTAGQKISITSKILMKMTEKLKLSKEMVLDIILQILFEK